MIEGERTSTKNSVPTLQGKLAKDTQAGAFAPGSSRADRESFSARICPKNHTDDTSMKASATPTDHSGTSSRRASETASARCTDGSLAASTTWRSHSPAKELEAVSRANWPSAESRA